MQLKVKPDWYKGFKLNRNLEFGSEDPKREN